MNKKSIILVSLILLLAVVSVLGLPFMVYKIEQRAESVMPIVTATPEPVYDDWEEYGGL